MIKYNLDERFRELKPVKLNSSTYHLDRIKKSIIWAERVGLFHCKHDGEMQWASRQERAEYKLGRQADFCENQLKL